MGQESLHVARAKFAWMALAKMPDKSFKETLNKVPTL
jgi:hypothetical protein